MSGSYRYTGPAEIQYLFVDGGCLRESLKNLSDRYFNGTPIEIDYAKLRAPFAKAFYYDAIPAQKANESDIDYQARTAPERALLDHLGTIDGFHVYEGDTRIRRRKQEQKKIDVMIAVDMLTHSFRRNIQRATLLTGDLDFKPLIDALVQEGMFVTLWYPVGETNKDLLSAADARRPLDIRDAYSMSTYALQKKFTLPAAWSEPRSSVLPIGKRWSDPAHGTIELTISTDGQYVLLFVDGHNPGYSTHIRHSDLDMIRKYCNDIFGIQVAEEAENQAK